MPSLRKWWAGAAPLVVLCGILYMMEHFGHKKMGMMRYLVFMNRQFERGLLQPAFITLLTGISLLILSFALYRLIRIIQCEECQGMRRYLALATTSGFWAGWALIPGTKAFLVFDFGFIGAMAFTLLSLSGIAVIAGIRFVRKRL